MRHDVPSLAGRVDRLAGAVYSHLAAALASHQGETYPLHIGDTWKVPPVGAHPEDIRLEDHPDANRYAPVPGLPALRAALAARVSERTGVAHGREQVLVTAGATGGLAAVVDALVDPGDRVLVLAPAWPLFSGMVRKVGGEAVHVPFCGAVDTPEQVGPALDDAAGDGPVTAVYLNTPNNPTGQVIERARLQAVVDWARARGAWIITDEVYEDFVFDGEHVYTRSLAPERTVSAWSFSKGFGMSGYRCGYVVGPAEVVEAATRATTYTYYDAPTPSQLAALTALGPAGDDWVAATREAYARLGRDAADALGLAHPHGSTFLFVDVAHRLDERGLEGFMADCVSDGLLVAPGSVFGPYPTHVRVCFTAVKPDRVRRGIAVLARHLGR